MIQNTERNMIQYLVLFNIVHQQGSAKEHLFFKTLDEYISTINSDSYRYCQQLSQKTPFEYALVLNFSNEAECQKFLDDEFHQPTFQTFWLAEVVSFMEVSLVAC